ncbi:basigin-like [Centruroides vittatus]|uniref:basigin-like n=1 Tax=Centruroides vittatus TaxID=120091 RepID=UPI00350FB7ED
MLLAIRNLILFVFFSICLINVTATLLSTEEQGKSTLLEIGKKFVLNCNITNPASTDITWYKDGILLNATVHISMENNSLIIKGASLKDTGTYMCTDQVNNLTFEVNSKIHITPFAKSLNLVQGDTLTLHCEAVAAPMPKLTWYKDDELINGTEDRVEFRTDDANVSHAKLIIKDLDYEDRATYMCLAENGIAEAVNATILVRVKDKLAALWPFLGICAEVAILCAIIFIYEKKRVKPDFDESDTDQIPESKGVADKDKVTDVRQRK